MEDLMRGPYRVGYKRPNEGVGWALCRLRLQHKLTLEEAAVIVGVTKQHWSLLELGKANPSEELLQRIGEEFNVPWRTLLRGKLPRDTGLQESTFNVFNEGWLSR
jgi:transcriptional regulator with XRE-family HTH domain